MIDAIFKDMKGCVWYLYDILIHVVNTEAEHQGIVKKVLQQCVKRVPAENLLKSKFNIHDTMFLVHFINS